MKEFVDLTIKSQEKVTELAEANKARLKEFARQRGLLEGVPDELFEQCVLAWEKGANLVELGHLLSLPFHLKKMRDDGVTDLVLTPASSIPYGFILKGIDEKLYPDLKRLGFIICSAKVTGEEAEHQAEKIRNYFANKKDYVVGVFDEVLSSRPESGHWNERSQAMKVQKILEDVLGQKVRGKYGTDTVYPRINANGELGFSHSQHGEEGKTLQPINIFSKVHGKNGVGYVQEGKYVDGHTQIEVTEKELNQGYVRIKHGTQGMLDIDLCYKLANIVAANYSANPNSDWDPLTSKKWWQYEEEKF
jgi:hypothetical protein